MEIVTITSISLAVLLVIGILYGLWRSWKKSLIRFGFIIVSFLAAFFLTSKISKLLMSRYVNGLVLSIFGQTFDFEEIAGNLAQDLFYEGSALTSFASALMNIVIKLVAFLIIFLAFFIVTLFIYWIISAVMNSKEKKNSVGDVKVRVWERFIGAGIGIISTLVICMVLFSPVFGLMNVCDKFLKEDTKPEASAYNETCLVAGKFYTEDDQIGTVESYLEKYDKLSKGYKKSFAGIMFRFTGVDALGKVVFNKISTVEYDGMTVNFTNECVNVVNLYNIYKESFVKEKFNLSKQESVDASKEMYEIAKNSEVFRRVIVDYVPNMASKWSNGEKFLNMEIPVTGDAKELVIDILKVFNSKDFSVLDRNISVIFDVIDVANKHDVIESVNGGTEILDVIDRDGFVKEEITALSQTPELKAQLPEIMTTMVKIAYKSVLDDPGTRLDQEFTQETISQIDWEVESSLTQTIISRMFKFFDTEEVIDCLTDFGVVIDSSRQSSILSKPVKTLMYDYINLKVDGLGDSKTTILNAINDNWNNQAYSFKDLFATVEVTAKIAKDTDSLEMTDMKETIKNLLDNDTNGDVKNTIKEAVNSGAISSLVDDEAKAEVYEDLLIGIIDDTESSTVDQDLQAGQVIVDIINNPKTEEGSVLDGYGNEGLTDDQKADIMVQTLLSSDTVMNVLDNEADKVDNSENSNVKNYIDNLSNSDKTAINNALDQYDATNPKIQTLSKLFGN